MGRRLTEEERSERDEDRERQENAKRRIAKQEVNSYEEFESSLKSLHLNEGLLNIKKAIESLSVPHPYDSNFLVKPQAPLEPSFSFKARKFWGSNQRKLLDLEQKLSFSLIDYAAFTGKRITSLGKQIFLLTIFGIPAVAGLLVEFNGLSILLLFLVGYKILILYQILNGIDKRFASTRGLEKFKSATMAELLNHKAEVLKLKADFDQSEQNRRYEEWKKHMENISLAEKRYQAELKKWEQKVAEATFANAPNELLRTNWIASLNRGDVKVMHEACELIFPISFKLNPRFRNADPSGFKIGYRVVSSELLCLCILVPKSLEFLPEFATRLKPSGREITQVINTEAKQIEASSSVLSGVVLGLTDLCFEIFPTINFIKIELGGNSFDGATGKKVIDLLIVLDISRKEFKTLKLKSIDPIAAIKRLAIGYKSPEASEKLKSIINQDDLFWATSNDKNVNLNSYIKELYHKSLT